MKKRLLSWLMALTLCLTLLPTAALADTGAGERSGSEKHEHYLCGTTDENHTCSDMGDAYKYTFTAWTEKNSLPKDSGWYYLTEDVTLDKTWAPTGGMAICLNGYNITMQTDGDVISLWSDLKLVDCKGGKGEYGKITHADGMSGHGVYLKNSAILTMYGGNITGNDVSTITDYTVKKDGGGVYAESGTSTIRQGRFTMYGGKITNNTAKNGGGVYNGSDRIFTMYGGSITDNRATNLGGGVFVDADSAGTAVFNVSGNVTITDNKENGSPDNIYLQEYSGKSAAITIGGELTGEIGVGAAAAVPVTIATGADSDKDYSNIITSDYYKYKVIHDSDDKTKLVLVSKTPTQKHEHYLCGKIHTDIGDHTSDEQINFATPLWMDGTTLMKGSEAWKLTPTTLNGSETALYVLPKGSYYLGSDIKLTASICIREDVQLCLNGCSIISDDYNLGSVIVDTGSSDAFTLTDCQNRGAITHATGKNGGGVYMNGNSTKFNMYGGSITGNSGSGVYVTQYNTFNMYGGSITDNNNSHGGGVYNGGTVNMYGGEIRGNTATTYGGGVYVDSYSWVSFKVSGSAKITGNTVDEKANNVYLPMGKTIAISGLTGGANIGVTTADEPTTSDNVIIAKSVGELTYPNIIKSDSNKYETKQIKGNLVLALKNNDSSKGHEHFLCGNDPCTCPAKETKKVAFQPWTSTMSLPATPGNWYLTKNVTLSSTWEPKDGTVLCLNGYSITANGDFNVIKVGRNATFTLTDCQTSQGSVTHADNKYGRGVEVEKGTFNLYGGIITGNNGETMSNHGGGVEVANGVFNMYGGKISGNMGGSYCSGGGVYVVDSSCTFNLYSGEISGNNGSSGGVEVYGTFNMSGGSITDNKATYGGGVEVRGRTAVFTMSGGKISGNTAGGGIGGGVLVLGGTFTVSGNVNITNNTAGGKTNNVYLSMANETVIGVTGALTGGARIGVTPETWPDGNGQRAIATGADPATGLTRYNMTSADMNCFQSDNGEYQTSLANNTVLLTKKGGGTSENIPVTGITLNTTTASLEVGKTTTLTATVEPSDATNKSVTWRSSDNSVATVAADGTVTAVKAGTATITATAEGDNSKFATCTVTVTGGTTPSQPSNPGGSTGGNTGGGSSSGSSDSNPVIKTETKNNADGSTTKTETRRDGSVTQTTTGKDGSVSKTETKPNGSSVTENKAADGSTGTVKTDKNGQTEAVAKVSGKAVEDAKKSGEAVKAPVEVEASRNSNTAPTVKIELPRNSGESKVEIPVSNVKSGTVAVLVHPDGTEEILKASVPTENGIRLTVDGSATVKIVDNSMDFIDTQNHWAKDEIDFVSARELVNGISATRYAPNATATRAHLWTILARQNDADLNGGNTWYEKAQLWSKDKGISDGTNPGAAINRAQMVTMLWRTMGQPAAAGRVSFVDVPANSYYAQAVAWAVENGITTGIGGGKFDPNSACTRAQIAAFLARSMK